MNRKKFYLILVLLQAVLGIFCLDLSQGATNLFLMDNIPKEDVSSAAAILPAPEAPVGLAVADNIFRQRFIDARNISQQRSRSSI